MTPVNDEYTIKLSVSSQELSTILAALRYYQEENQGEPEERSDRIHAIATDDDNETSMNTDGIDALCERINFSGVHDDDSGKPSGPPVDDDYLEDDPDEEDEE